MQRIIRDSKMTPVALAAQVQPVADGIVDDGDSNKSIVVKSSSPQARQVFEEACANLLVD